MLLIPAIDLKDGKCVRLRQGEMDRVTVFSEDPLATAARWFESGARRLHIVDLDGAAQGKADPTHRKIIASIAKSFPDFSIQVGGGIRDEETISNYLDCGVAYTIIGTRAITHPDFMTGVCAKHPQHIILGLDAKDEKLAVRGWTELSAHNVFDFAQKLDTKGLEAIIFTDISRDGMRLGINLAATAKLASRVDVPIYASGGFNSMRDIEALCQQRETGIAGAIIGRALYDGAVDYAKAQHYANRYGARPPEAPC